MADVALAQQLLPARQAAKRASTNISQQLNDSDSDSPPDRRGMSQNRIIVKYGKKGKSVRRRRAPQPNLRGLKPSREPGELHFGNLGMSPALKVANKSTRRKPTSLEAKQHHEPTFSTDILSDSELTPITSSAASTPQPSLPPTPPRSPLPNALQPFPLLPKLDEFDSHRKNKRKRREEIPHPKSWKREQLGDYVWVLIDNLCRVFDLGDSRAQGREYIWWPAKISRLLSDSGAPLQILLYGKTSLKGKRAEIINPTENNVLPFESPAGEAQFQAPTFVTPCHEGLSDVMRSPRKKTKRDHGDLERRWRGAIQELCAEREGNQTGPSTMPPIHQHNSNARPSLTRDTDEESLPEVGEYDWKASLASLPIEMPGNGYPTKIKRKEAVQGQGKQRQKGKRKASPIPDDESDYGIRQLEEGAWGTSGENEWLLPAADETLQIPGELIFALGTGGDRKYWPARVLEYISPKTTREKEGKYKIEYLDRKTAVLKRSSFYTWEEDGFVTCKLGQFESSYDENANDSETEEPLDSFLHGRDSSPIPAHPPPLAAVFCELDVRSQFAYTKPILVAVLNEQYPPARERHDNFLKGGLARKSTVDGAALRGEMDPRSVAELHKRLCYWCLRDEISAGLGGKTVSSGDNSLELQYREAEAVLAVASPKRRQDLDAAASGGEEPQELEGLISAQRSQNAETPGNSVSVILAQETSVINSAIADEPRASQLSLSSAISTASTPPPSADIPMEDADSIAQDSPLSPLSSISETTPAPVECNEDYVVESTKDVDGAVPGVTDGEDSAHIVSLNHEAKGTEIKHPQPRQYGCTAFEALTTVEKLDYCLNVLLPEAIIQILLWRKGLRRTMELFSPEEEQRLHEEGMKLLQVTDWVFDVMRLRHSRERSLGLGKKINGDPSSSQKSEHGRGRLRNVGRVNYVE